MTTKVMSKKQTQQIIKDLRHAEYTVTKDKFGKYDCLLDEVKLFTAMPGIRSYLVRYADNLLQKA